MNYGCNAANGCGALKGNSVRIRNSPRCCNPIYRFEHFNIHCFDTSRREGLQIWESQKTCHSEIASGIKREIHGFFTDF